MAALYISFADGQRVTSSFLNKETAYRVLFDSIRESKKEKVDFFVYADDEGDRTLVYLARINFVVISDNDAYWGVKKPSPEKPKRFWFW
jgi:hypothetical protein